MFKRIPVLPERASTERDEPAPIRQVVHAYYLDTAFLQRLQVELTQRPEEEALIVSGVRFADQSGMVVSVPTSGFMPRYKTSSRSGVEADPESVHAILSNIERNGQVVLARFHSHPGPGIGMAQPSGTDIRDQMNWEAMGYQTVSGIFTRTQNGTFFLRMFTVDLPMSITIIGTASRRARRVWEIPAEPIFEN